MGGKKQQGVNMSKEEIAFDYKDRWDVFGIQNKQKFMKSLFHKVPEDSVWYIEGIDEGSLKLLDEFKTTDDIKIGRNTIWPKQEIVKIFLSSKNRERIFKLLPTFDFNLDFTHQFVYRQNLFYLVSFDNLDDECTYLSKVFDEVFLTNLAEACGCKFERYLEK